MIKLLNTTFDNNSYLYKRTKRSLNVQKKMHDLAETYRDFTFRTTLIDDNHLHLQSEFLDAVLNEIRLYVSSLDSDSGICVSYRAVTECDKSKFTKGFCLKTLKRSGDLSPRRKFLSEPIPLDAGIAKLMLGNNRYDRKGIIMIGDVKAAIEKGDILNTQTDKTFPEEIKSLVCIPVNLTYYEDKRKFMGILYFSSNKKSAFKVNHYDSYCYIADTFAHNWGLLTQQ